MSLIPPLFRSAFTQADPTKFGPGYWNALVDLITRLFATPTDTDGYVLTRDSTSINGASWHAPSGGGGGAPPFGTGYTHVTAGAWDTPAALTEANITGLVADLALKATLASPTLTGVPAAPTAAPGTTTTQLATTAFVAAVQVLLATLASPALTGTPTAPTAAPGTNTTQLATTAFIQAAVAALVASAPGTLDTLNELALALGSDPNFATTIATALGLKAALASPTFTGVPVAPTAAPGTNTTQLATTAFDAASMALEVTARNAAIAALIVNLSTNASGVLQAAQEPAHTGDVTNTAGSLALAIGAAKVTNAMLAGSITAAKLVGSDLVLTESQITSLVADLAARVTLTGAQVVTSKQITPRVQTVASSATVTPSPDTDDVVVITAQAAGLTLANPTPVVNVTQGQKLIIRIKDNGTARAISYGTQYRALGTALPATTVISKTLYLGLIYNATDTKWDLVAAAQEA